MGTNMAKGRHRKQIPAEKPNATLLRVMKKVYRKHVLEDESVGWESLCEEIGMALADVMGDEAFNKWVERVDGKDKI
jgi:hypothetical protein